MTIDEFKEAITKFGDYLAANGQRPIAMIAVVCNDQTNTTTLVSSGNAEMLDEACVRTMAKVRGIECRYEA